MAWSRSGQLGSSPSAPRLPHPHPRWLPLLWAMGMAGGCGTVSSECLLPPRPPSISSQSTEDGGVATRCGGGGQRSMGAGSRWHPPPRVWPLQATHVKPASSPSCSRQVPPFSQGPLEQLSRGTSQSRPWGESQGWGPQGPAGANRQPPLGSAACLSQVLLVHSFLQAQLWAGTALRAPGADGERDRPPWPPGAALLLPGPASTQASPHLIAAGAGTPVPLKGVVMAAALVLARTGQAGITLGLDSQIRGT